MPRDTGDFKVKETVLVSFTDQKYEAKVVKAEKYPDGIWRYFIHYPGWNKSHDEWVPATDLCKYDESKVNVRDPSAVSNMPASGPADLQPPQPNVSTTSHSSKPPQSRPSLHQQPAPTQAKHRSSDKRPKKRPRTAPASVANDVDDELSQAEIDLPLSLKQVLLEEHKTLSQEDRLPPPPHVPSVSDILAQYIDHSTSRDANGQASEIASGIQDYFDMALPQWLLYDEELDDYKETSDEHSPSALYGGQHLLRLLVKLPDFLPSQSFSAGNYMKAQHALTELIGYLHDNAAHFFPASSERL